MLIRLQNSVTATIDPTIEALYEIKKVCRPFVSEARLTYRLENGTKKILEELAQLIADERQAVANSSPYLVRLSANDCEVKPNGNSFGRKPNRTKRSRIIFSSKLFFIFALLCVAILQSNAIIGFFDFDEEGS